MGRKPGGKGPDFTAEMQERFLRAIRLGCPIKDACGCAGISESTYYRWNVEAEQGLMTKGAKAMREFQKKIKRAEGEATQGWLAIIERAAQDGTWQAAAWKLERRRSMFIPKTRQEVTGEDGKAIQIESGAREARELIEDAVLRFATREGTGKDPTGTGSESTH